MKFIQLSRDLNYENIKLPVWLHDPQSEADGIELKLYWVPAMIWFNPCSIKLHISYCVKQLPRILFNQIVCYLEQLRCKLPDVSEFETKNQGQSLFLFIWYTEYWI